MNRIKATPQEIESRVRQMCLLMEAKWDIIDKAVIVHKHRTRLTDADREAAVREHEERYGKENTD